MISKELEILYNANYEPHKNPKFICKTSILKTDF